MSIKLMCKKFVFLAVFLCFIGFISDIYTCDAGVQQENLRLAQGDYRKLNPMDPYDISPTPDIIQDREWREDRAEKVEQAIKSTEAVAEEELTSEEEPSTLVASEPTKIYYRISVNDKLHISVWRIGDLSLDVIVGPDGKISYPLIGDVHAAGKTLAELDDELTERIKEYVENPQVSVMVTEYAGNKLIVLGEVSSPGIYKFIGKTNIIQVIALAGGFTDRSKSASIVIVRKSDDPENDRNLVVAHIKDILKGDLSKNIEVKPDDIVYVSRTFISNAREFYNNWLVPLMSAATDVEAWRSLKESRIRTHK